MHSVQNGAAVELTVPADTAMMLIIRLTTSGIAARSGMSMANIDDFKIAVEEAVSYLLYGAELPESVHLKYVFDENSVEVTANGEGVSDRPPLMRDETEMEIIRAILATLTDEAEVSDENGRKVVLRKRCR